MDNKDLSIKLRKIVENKVNNSLNGQISGFNGNNFNDFVGRIDLKPVEDEICEEFKQVKLQRQPAIWSDFNVDFYDYKSFIQNLSSNSTITKLKVLDELLNIPIIDTKQNEWQELSLILRKCFINANNEIFQRTLRVHYKIVTFPNTSSDGYLNLLCGCLLLINSRYFGDLTKNRVRYTIKLILTIHQFVAQQLLHTNYRQIDEILHVFVEIINSQQIFDLIGLYDTKTNWLRYFCYGSYIRNSIFQQIKRTQIVTIVVNEFLNYLNNPTINKVYYGYFLLYFLNYRSNFDYFPIQLDGDRTITVENLLELIIQRVNRDKNDDLLEILYELSRNNHRIFSGKFLDLLLENFNAITESNLENLIENNRHVFIITRNLAKSSNFRVLFGNCNKLRKTKSSMDILKNTKINVSQKIIDLIVQILRIGEPIDLTLILDCCYHIYKSHKISFYYINSGDLLKELCNLYGITTRFDCKLEILNLLNYFYSNYQLTTKIIGCDQQILNDLFIFTRNTNMLILMISYNDQFYDLLKTVSVDVIKPYLQRIWQLDEKHDGYLLIIDNNFNTNVVIDFLFFIYVVKLNFKSILLFLIDPNDSDDRTIVGDNDDDITNLSNLIEKCLNDYQQTFDEYLGLLMVKVLINNLDVMIYLETNYQIQDKLSELQQISTIDGNLIIDAYTTLRHNILTTMKSTGFVDVELDENIFEMVELNQFESIINNPMIEDDIELKEFLQQNHRNKDFGWLLQARRYFKQSLNYFNPTIISLLLKQTPKTYIYRKFELIWPPSDSVYHQLYPEDFTGISTIINFGKLRQLLLNSAIGEEQLALLIKQSRVFIGYQPDDFHNFDWFVGLIYLINFGDLNQCRDVLIHFTQIQIVSLIWKTFGSQYDGRLQENFYQQLAIVLEDNCQSFKALQMLEINVEILVRFWLNQCFFNLLNFEEICNFLSFLILYPPECLLYYIVAIFQHLNNKICTISHTKTVENMLKMCDLSDFRLDDYLDFIEKLMRQYRNVHKF